MTDHAQALAEALRALADNLQSLIQQSEGVAGLHLNGDVAPWETLFASGAYEDWFGTSFDDARAALATYDAAPAPGTEAFIRAAIAEYDLCDNMAGRAENMGRKAAVRGMMVRLGLYAQFNDALEECDDANPTPITAPAPSDASRIDEAVLKEKMRMMEWCAKRQKITRLNWERAARKALAGDLSELRTRIDLIDAGPLDVVLSGEREQP